MCGESRDESQSLANEMRSPFALCITRRLQSAFLVMREYSDFDGARDTLLNLGAIAIANPSQYQLADRKNLMELARGMIQILRVSEELAEGKDPMCDSIKGVTVEFDPRHTGLRPS